jgi:hypothetical protein
MASYNLQATDASQSTPKLQRGPVTIRAYVGIYFKVGEEPIADSGTCALLRAGESRTLNLPVKCSKIAVLAVKDTGTVTISEEIGGAKASCSS